MKGENSGAEKEVTMAAETPKWMLAIQNNPSFQRVPLLRPDRLSDLALLDEGSRTALIEIFRSQQSHGNTLENQALTAQIRLLERLQRGTLVLGVVGLILAATIALAKNGSTVGAIAILIALAAIVPMAIFILTQRSPKEGATANQDLDQNL